MNADERIYSMSEIRERRRATSQMLALQQRQLDALAKMDEAAAELEQVEREMEALSRGGPQPEQPTEALPQEPKTTGERALKILRDDHPDTWLYVRDVLAGMEERGWVDTDRNVAMQRLRHSLPRLVQSNARVERDETDTGHRYRYVSRTDGYASAAVSRANGAAYPALQGRQNDS